MFLDLLPIIRARCMPCAVLLNKIDMGAPSPTQLSKSLGMVDLARVEAKNAIWTMLAINRFDWRLPKDVLRIICGLVLESASKDIACWLKIDLVLQPCSVVQRSGYGEALRYIKSKFIYQSTSPPISRDHLIP